VGEIVEWLNAHHAAGKIQAFGGSNWTWERIRAANAYAAEHDLVPFTATSPHFSLAIQVDNPWGPGCVSLTGDNEQAARDWHIANDMPVFAYSSLARGLMSGRITRENAADTADGACLKAYGHPCNFERLDRAGQLAVEKGVSVPQIAIAYILAHPLNVFPLLGAANREECEANAAAATIALTPADVAWLENGEA
jgi:aryl-alcohol dehydrogenase-like predicted oxidoreductase